MRVLPQAHGRPHCYYSKPGVKRDGKWVAGGRVAHDPGGELHRTIVVARRGLGAASLSVRIDARQRRHRGTPPGACGKEIVGAAVCLAVAALKRTRTLTRMSTRQARMPAPQDAARPLPYGHGSVTQPLSRMSPPDIHLHEWPAGPWQLLSNRGPETNPDVDTIVDAAGKSACATRLRDSRRYGGQAQPLLAVAAPSDGRRNSGLQPGRGNGVAAPS